MCPDSKVQNDIIGVCSEVAMKQVVYFETLCRWSTSKLSNKSKGVAYSGSSSYCVVLNPIQTQWVTTVQLGMPCFMAVAENGIHVSGADLLLFTAHISSYHSRYCSKHGLWLMVSCSMNNTIIKSHKTLFHFHVYGTVDSPKVELTAWKDESCCNRWHFLGRANIQYVSLLKGVWHN